MRTSTPPSIHLEAVAKTYAAGRADEVRALRTIDVTVRPAEFVSVEGPSGCGKTSLLNLLGLLDRPTSGRVLWNDRSMSELSERERARTRLTGVGFIFQRFLLVPTLTARENVELPLRARGVRGAERRLRAEALLRDVGLEGRKNAYPHELSGGEEQRVAIARALANDPGVLLADEPTGELDRAHAEGVLDLLVAVRERTGATFVVVTHNPVVAARAHRHLGMDDGRIVSDSSGA